MKIEIRVWHCQHEPTTPDEVADLVRMLAPGRVKIHARTDLVPCDWKGSPCPLRSSSIESETAVSVSIGTPSTES